MSSVLLDRKNWDGIWTALITPLNSDGTLDTISLSKLIELQIEEGVHGLVIAGSTGEGSLLDSKVYVELLSKAKEIVGDRVHLVAGLGIGGTDQSIANLRLAKDLGYGAVLASPPAYVKAPSRGLKKHFLELAKEGVAICLYEVPSRAASSIPEELLGELVGNQTYGKYFVAIKDASTQFDRLKKWISKFHDRVAFLSGDDETYPKFLDLGGDGVVSVASHFLLPEFKQIQNREKGWTDHFNQRCVPFIRDLFIEANPIPVKSLLHREGVISKLNFCSPLCPMEPNLLLELGMKWKLVKDMRKAGS